MTSDKIAAECELLQQWIKKRQSRREGTGDLSARLIALRAKQIRAEIRQERKAGRVSNA